MTICTYSNVDPTSSLHVIRNLAPMITVLKSLWMLSHSACVIVMRLLFVSMLYPFVWCYGNERIGIPDL